MRELDRFIFNANISQPHHKRKRKRKFTDFIHHQDIYSESLPHCRRKKNGSCSVVSLPCSGPHPPYAQPSRAPLPRRPLRHHPPHRTHPCPPIVQLQGTPTVQPSAQSPVPDYPRWASGGRPAAILPIDAA